MEQEKIIVASESQLNAIISKAVNIEFRRVLSEHTLTKPECHDLIGIKEAIEVTGYARQTLYGLVNDRKIQFIKKSGFRKLHFSRKAILDWLADEK